jgi:hypothetical protein
MRKGESFRRFRHYCTKIDRLRCKNNAEKAKICCIMLLRFKKSDILCEFYTIPLNF